MALFCCRKSSRNARTRKTRLEKPERMLALRDMVYGFVQEHKGHIRCYNEPGYGTTFKICFPSRSTFRYGYDSVHSRLNATSHCQIKGAK